jgi:hypothetical protein
MIMIRGLLVVGVCTGSENTEISKRNFRAGTIAASDISPSKQGSSLNTTI